MLHRYPWSTTVARPLLHQAAPHSGNGKGHGEQPLKLMDVGCDVHYTFAWYHPGEDIVVDNPEPSDSGSTDGPAVSAPHTLLQGFLQALH